MFTSKSSDKKDNSQKLQQNRFEILGCLREDVKVSEEEQQDGGAVRNSPDTMLSPTPPLRTNMRDSKLHSWNFGHKSTASEGSSRELVKLDLVACEEPGRGSGLQR